MPLPCDLFERALSFIEHEAFDLLGAFAHLRELTVDLDELDCKVVLAKHCHKSLEISFTVDVPALKLCLVDVVPHFLQVDQSYFTLVVLDLVPAQVVYLEITVLEGQNSAVEVFLLEFAWSLQYLILKSSHFLLEDVLYHPNLPFFHVNEANNHQYSCD